MMRVGTLEDPVTLRFLAERFVLVTHNQLPQLYCSGSTVDTTTTNPYPKEQMAQAPEGSGGGNVRSYFCTPDGRVVSYIAGRWGREKFLAEARWALERMDEVEQRPELLRAHRRMSFQYASARDSQVSPEELEEIIEASITAKPQAVDGRDAAEIARRWKLYHLAAAYNRLIRSHHEVREILMLPIDEVLQKVEDDVYIKGAIGCDS
jgi:hypothetical protein